MALPLLARRGYVPAHVPWGSGKEPEARGRGAGVLSEQGSLEAIEIQARLGP